MPANTSPKYISSKDAGAGQEAKKALWVSELNTLLAQEHACAIRYATHAAVITGPYREPVAARLTEIAGDEVGHAKKLRERIVALDGTPTMDVQREDLKHATSLEEILEINMAEEREAIVNYTRLLETIPRTNAILYDCIEAILAVEQEHLEQLQDLMPA